MSVVVLDTHKRANKSFIVWKLSGDIRCKVERGDFVHVETLSCETASYVSQNIGDASKYVYINIYNRGFTGGVALKAEVFAISNPVLNIRSSLIGNVKKWQK